MENLKHKTIRGSVVMGGATAGLRVITMLSTIVLARLLEVADFGLVAFAGIVLSTTSLFSNLGMGLAVIHSRAEPEKVAWQAFVVTAISGTFFSVLVVVGAPVFAWLLGASETVPIIRAMAPWVLLGALASVPEAVLQKKLLFGRVSAGMLVSEILSTVVSLVMAFLGYGVWSLVAGGLVRGAAYLVLLWAFSSEREWLRPKPWDRELMRGLSSYGSRSMGAGIVSFLYSILDNLLVGRTLGVVALGLYSKAYDYTTRSVDLLTNAAGVVLFPSYATLQEEPARLSRAFFKSLRLIALVTTPISMGLFATARLTIPIILGEKWMPMIPAFEVLCWVSLVKTLSGSTGALFASTGHPGYNLRAALLVLACMVPLIFLLLGYGIFGVAIALLITHVLGFAFNVFQVRLLFPGMSVGMPVAIGPAIAGGLLMVALTLGTRAGLQRAGIPDGAMTLILMIVIGAGSYAGFVWWNQRPLVLELLGVFRSRFAGQSQA